MTLAFQRNHSRHCSRCGLPLEDPASEERGVGPVCAQKDTTLFARTIPANYAGATAILLAVKAEMLPEETRERYEALKEKVFARAQKAITANDDIAVIHLTGQDLRPIIKELDWILSHKMDTQYRRFLVSVVKELGYVELSAVLSQEASTSVAPLWFQNGRVFLKGKSCKVGFSAMRAIPGIQMPKYRGSTLPYSVPVSQLERFLKIVSYFWPMYTVVNPDQTPIDGGTLDTIRQKAQEWLQTQEATSPSPEAVSAPAGPVATLQRRIMTTGVLRGEVVQVNFRWLFEKTNQMYALVSKLKEIPKQERSYDNATKNWFFLPKHKEKVVEAVSQLFVVQEVAPTG